jgi:hypothetical protein
MPELVGRRGANEGRVFSSDASGEHEDVKTARTGGHCTNLAKQSR